MATTTMSEVLSIPSSQTRLAVPGMGGTSSSSMGAGGRRSGRPGSGSDLEAVDAMEFFVKRASQIDQERKVFNDFVRLVAPNEAELMNLQWDERHFQEEQESLESEVRAKEAEIASVQEEVSRKMRALHEAKVAQRVRQAQIVRLSSLSRPVDNDTTYLISDRAGISMSLQHLDNSNSSGDNDTFQKTYIKIPRSGELVRLEGQLNQSFSNVTRNCKRLAEKLADFKEPPVSAFLAHSPGHRVAADMLAKLEKLELQNMHLVREYLKLRLDVMVAQRENVQSQETLRQCRGAYRDSENQLNQKLAAGVQAIKSKFDKDLRDTSKQLDAQMEAVAEKLDALKVAKKKVQSATSTDDDRTREEVAVWREKYRKLSERYRLEMEGYNSEMAILRARLKKVQSVTVGGSEDEAAHGALSSYVDDEDHAPLRKPARRPTSGAGKRVSREEPVLRSAKSGAGGATKRPASASAASRRAHESHHHTAAASANATSRR